MDFWHTIKQSVYGPEFYRDLREKTVSYSLKYFYTLGVLLAVILTVFYSAAVLPAAIAFIRDVGPKIVASYPEGLEVTIKNGEAKTNVAEPYMVSIPEPVRQAVAERERYRNLEYLVVLDTREPFTIEKFRGHSTLLLLSKDAIVFSDDDGTLRIQPLEGVSDVTLTKGLVVSLVNTLQSFAKFLPPIIVFLIFFGLIVVHTFRLLYALAAGCIIWLMLRIGKRGAAYARIFRASLHAMTLPMLATVVLQLILPGFLIPFLFTSLFVVSLIMNRVFSGFREVPPPAVPPQTPAAT